MAHGDYNAHEKKLLERYDVTKTYGVQNLFHDIHDLRQNRFAGTDTTFLSCILIDFERLVRKARLTQRQSDAIFYHFELDLSQSEVAEIMGVSQQAVSKHVDTVVRKIVIEAKQEGGVQ
jgi:DNA-binding CsgD family transcriptional regulator